MYPGYKEPGNKHFSSLQAETAIITILNDIRGEKKFLPMNCNLTREIKTPAEK